MEEHAPYMEGKARFIGGGVKHWEVPFLEGGTPFPEEKRKEEASRVRMTSQWTAKVSSPLNSRGSRDQFRTA